MNKKKLLYLILILILLAVAVIFTYSKFFAITPIAEIKNHPRQYVGEKVQIQGQVTKVFSLAFLSYFEVTDGKDTIFVYTRKPLPVEGEKLKVKGIVKYFTLGKERFIAVEEQ